MQFGDGDRAKLGVQGLEPWTRGFEDRGGSDASTDATDTSDKADSSTASGTASETEEPDLNVLVQALAELSDEDRELLGMIETTQPRGARND